jgi:hypothetical protein
MLISFQKQEMSPEEINFLQAEENMRSLENGLLRSPGENVSPLR